MFERFLKFFIENSRMNYTLFVLIFAIGIWSYTKTPKEIFPTFDLDMVSIKGSYTGASVDILDRMAVSEIEDNVKNLESVDTMTTIISPGKFSIVLELKKGFDRYQEADKVKDIITLTKSNLPSDMDEPTVKVLDRTRTLLDLALTSKKFSVDELKPLADNFKSEILNVSGINEINIFGDSDKYFEVLLDDHKIDALGLNKSEVFNAIANISYIFPIGKIEDPKKHYYISTYNGAKNAEDFGNTLIRISNTNVYVRDIATIAKKYEDASTLYSLNGQNSISLQIVQADTADAIQIVKDIKKILPGLKKANPDVNFEIADDNSERIIDRLNVVTSNILFGIIMITILVALLINFRMSFIIAMGIPTSFVIAAVYMYLSGYTINMISLVGVLIAIGIVVDDAIVVSENIQQHIEEGFPPKEAALMGAKEMVEPVTIASITTLFSFLPILMISGTMGEVMKLIPIALSALVVASLIETFLFLPIHAVHSLKNEAKVTNWEKANNVYNKILHFFMRFKKIFIVVFIIIVPFFTWKFIADSRFQMFPKFDSTDVKITLKANENTTLEQAFDIVTKIEADIMKKKEKFYIRNINSIAGYRKDVGNNTENFPYAMYMTVELDKLKPMNFVDKYVTPYLSFYYDDEGRNREEDSQKISKMLKNFIEKQNYKEKYNLQEIAVLEKRVGPIKSDIQIGVVTQDNQKAIWAVELLTEKLLKLEGMKSASNSLKFGIDEIKLKINPYGESLGLSEAFVGNYLSNLYLSKKKAVSFDEKEMLDIKIKSKNKDDFESFRNTKIPVNDSFVVLSEIADLNSIRAFEQLIKDEGVKNFYVFANVNPDVLTASEAIKKIDETLKEIKDKGIKLVFKGEEEKKAALKHDMLLATALALTLIMLSMLYLFNSFRETFIVMSVIPFSLLGVLIGHQIMGLNLSMPSIIGALGLAGVVINDGIIMMTYLKKAKSMDEIFSRATKRFRPIVITTVTTLIGMTTLIFFPSGEAVIFQPIAIALGFGLAWGTILNLIYLPILFTLTHRLRKEHKQHS